MQTQTHVAARLWAIVKRNWGWDALDIARAYPTTTVLLEQAVPMAHDRVVPDGDAGRADLDAVIDACLQIMEQNPISDMIDAAITERNGETDGSGVLHVVE